MSLHQLAQQIQANGRGNDTLLVHMAPAEVRAMRKLAQQHGGDLSINPKTGLPEAGFLEQILPTVVGAGVGIMTANPMLGAAAGGALGMAMNKGSIQSGLMAGLGAYGMGSLGAGLLASGAGAGAAAAGAETAAAASSLYAPAEIASMQAAGMTPAQITASAADFAGGASGVGSPAMPFTQATQNALSSPVSAGMSEIAKAPGEFFKKNMFPIGAAAAPLLMGGSGLFGGDNSAKQDEANKGMIRPATYSQAYNPRYGEPGQAPLIQKYTAQEPIAASDFGSRSVYMADGGLASIRMAEGGDAADPRFTAPGVTDADRYRYLAAQTAPPPAYASMPLAPQAQQPSYPAYAPPPTIQPQMAAIQQRYAAPQRQAPAAFEYQQPAFVKYGIDSLGSGYGSGGGGGSNANALINPVTKQPVKTAAQIIAAKPKPTAGSGGSSGVFDTYGNEMGPNDIYSGPGYYDRYPVAEVYNYETNQPTRPFNPNEGSPEFNVPSNVPVDPSSGMAEIQQMFANQGYTDFIPSATTDYYGNTGGDADGGLIADKHPKYAMGGGIGGYYPEPDDGNRNFGGIGALNQGPQYPMQGIGYAMGGQLGGYSDGGQLLRGPGDGVSDDIPAQIGARQPARLADGEFVVPARIVSELGNGSTDAGAKRLYAMMDRVQQGRTKSVGKGKVAVDSKAYKHLPT